MFPEGQFGKDKNGEDIPGELDLSKVIVWVDPLDATRSYTEGYLDEVTTLIGLSYEGKARLGVVGSFFSKGGSSENPEYQFAPKVYLADSLNSQCTVIDHSRQISTIKPRAYDKARMRLSTTRSKIPENIMTFMKDVSTEIIRQGGMGKKVTISTHRPSRFLRTTAKPLSTSAGDAALGISQPTKPSSSA